MSDVEYHWYIANIHGNQVGDVHTMLVCKEDAEAEGQTVEDLAYDQGYGSVWVHYRLHIGEGHLT